MATNDFPTRNVNYPFTQAQLDLARARLTPKRSVDPGSTSPSGRGTRWEARPGEWIDDRRIVIGGPATPSKGPDPRAPLEPTQMVYDVAKVYEVQLAKSVLVDGRWLSPALTITMVGAVAESITGSILTATEVGDVPADPDAAPTGSAPEPTSSRRKA